MSNIEKIKAEIERRKKRWMYDDLPIAMGRYYEDRDLLAFIDSLPEDDPLNDPRFGEGFDAGRAVQRIFDETEEKPSEDLEEAAREIVIKMHPCLKDCTILGDRLTRGQLMALVKAGAEWMESRMPMPEDTVIFMKGVAEGRRLEREDREENKRKEDELPRFYGD